jgi:hypothetical protein
MKTTVLSKITSVLLAVFVSFTALAGEKDAFNASVQLNEDTDVTIRLNGDSPNKIEIKIYDNTGEMVTYKSLTNSGTRVFKHKLSELPDGIYTYEVVEGNEVVYSARVTKSDENAIEYLQNSSGSIASISKLSEEQVIVRFADNPEAKSKVRVSDEYGNLLYRRTMKDVESAKLTYDISDFPEGNYNFKVYSGGELIAYRKVNK